MRGDRGGRFVTSRHVASLLLVESKGKEVLVESQEPVRAWQPNEKSSHDSIFSFQPPTTLVTRDFFPPIQTSTPIVTSKTSNSRAILTDASDKTPCLWRRPIPPYSSYLSQSSPIHDGNSLSSPHLQLVERVVNILAPILAEEEPSVDDGNSEMETESLDYYEDRWHGT